MNNYPIFIFGPDIQKGPCRRISFTICELDMYLQHPSISSWASELMRAGMFMPPLELELLRASYDTCPTTCLTLDGKEGAQEKLDGIKQQKSQTSY